MKSNKNHGTKKDNDINFVPLDIQEPFKFNSSSLSPIIQVDGTSISAHSKDIFIGFPPVFLNTLDKSITNAEPISTMPLMPYPVGTPNIDSTDINPKDINTKSNTFAKDLEYPSDVNSDDLYSYNKPRVDDDYLNNTINPIDILRNFDLQEDIIEATSRGSYSTADIDEIYRKIELDNTSILATMKAYRIPYPIAKLLIKKIIKLTLDYKNGR